MFVHNGPIRIITGLLLLLCGISFAQKGIPITFELKKPGYVPLVIEDSAGV